MVREIVEETMGELVESIEMLLILCFAGVLVTAVASVATLAIVWLNRNN